MFDLLDKPLVWISVSWPALLPPKDDDALAEPGEHTVELRVELIETEEAISLFPTLFPDREEETAKEAEKYPEVWAFKAFKRVVKDWRKISAHGQAVPLNDKNIKLLLRAPLFIAGFVTAYFGALGGKMQEREGNSAASPSGGRGDQKEAAPTKSKKTARASG